MEEIIKRFMPTDHYDIVIIGGGPVGMALALALNDTGISCLLLEARELTDKTEDPRPLALSYGSHLILQRLSVWSNLQSYTPITTIHISNRGSLGLTILTPEQAGVPTLGFVVNYHDLYTAMHNKLTAHQNNYAGGAIVTRLDVNEKEGTVYFNYQGKEEKTTATLLVLADGGQLAKQIPDITYQSYDYQQWAVVANVKADIKQSGIAYERFTSNGPIALLPHHEDFALVWTVSPETAKEITTLDDETFVTRLYQHFGDRLGKFVAAGKRSAFPLMLKFATPNISQRIALIGNAAQTLHPVAGQGFNLGLRDAYELANEIISTQRACAEIGTSAMLSRYHQKRQIDSYAGRFFTDSLVKIFTNESRILKQTCGFGLSILDCMPPLKRFISRRMIFGARG